MTPQQNHRYGINRDEMESIIEALSYAWQDAALTEDRQEFKELRNKFREALKHWPQDGDTFKDVLVELHGDKSWDDFSDEMHLLFDQADKGYLDRVVNNAISDCDEGWLIRDFIVDALQEHVVNSDPIYERIAELFKTESNSRNEEN